MRLCRRLLAVCVLSVFALFSLAASASASGRTFVGAATGVGVGLVGLELEYRFDSRWAIAGTGRADVVHILDVPLWSYISSVNVRYYFTSGTVNPFVNLGGMATGVAVLGDASYAIPGVLATGGLEVMLGRIRVAGEVGYEASFDKTRTISEFTYRGSLGACF